MGDPPSFGLLHFVPILPSPPPALPSVHPVFVTVSPIATQQAPPNAAHAPTTTPPSCSAAARPVPTHPTAPHQTPQPSAPGHHPSRRPCAPPPSCTRMSPADATAPEGEVTGRFMIGTGPHQEATMAFVTPGPRGAEADAHPKSRIRGLTHGHLGIHHAGWCLRSGGEFNLVAVQQALSGDGPDETPSQEGGATERRANPQRRPELCGCVLGSFSVWPDI